MLEQKHSTESKQNSTQLEIDKNKTESEKLKVKKAYNFSKANKSSLFLCMVKGCCRVAILGTLIALNNIFPKTASSYADIVSNTSIQVSLSVLGFLVLHLIAYRIKNFIDEDKSKNFMTLMYVVSDFVSATFLVILARNNSIAPAIRELYLCWLLFTLLHWIEMIFLYRSHIVGKIYKYFADASHEVSDVEYSNFQRLLVSVLMVVAISIVWISIIHACGWCIGRFMEYIMRSTVSAKVGAPLKV